MWLFWSSIFLLLYAGINIYTGIRVFALIRFFLPFFRVFIFWPFYIFLCYSFIILTLLRFDWLRPFRPAALISFPAIVYFFLALIFVDGVRLVLWLAKRIPASALAFTPAFSAAAVGIALFLMLFTMIYGFLHARNISTVHYEINLDKDGAGLDQTGLRIALVSDLHIGAMVDRKLLANIVDEINKAEPDIICMAGDIFDSGIDSIKDPEGVIEELRRLKAPLGIYASLGNHDVDRLNWGELISTKGISGFLKKAGIVTLQDEFELLANSFYLAGRRDLRPIGRQSTEDGEASIQPGRKSAIELTASLDKSRPIIFMDHQPLDFPGMEEAGADLILSGHTHRGQFFPGNLATARIFKKAGSVHYGHWQGPTAQGVVSSGAGVWGPSVRVGSNSEVTVIDVSFSGGL